MIYVYILGSSVSAGRFYFGVTDDLKARLKEHNAGDVFHTSKYRPWVVKNYFAFRDRAKAYAFEIVFEVGLRPHLCQAALLTPHRIASLGFSISVISVCGG